MGSRSSCRPPPLPLRKLFLGKKLNFMKGARNWKPLQVHELGFGLSPPADWRGGGGWGLGVSATKQWPVRGKGTYGGRPGQRVEEQGTWASHTQKHSEAGYGRPVDRGAWTAQTVKRPRQQPAQPPMRQLLGTADAQTVHPAAFSTAPAHQRLGSANAETTPAGAPAAAADRTQRPDATCEGKNG